MRPSDHSARSRFAEELGTNFSAIAAAGSGKTRAITERVLEIARSANAATLLPQLVVVTFANRAADEMQQRARQKILDEHLPLEVQTAFNRAFFGTIHAFCMKLLTTYGHHLGLPTPLELISDDDDLWQEFVQQQTRLGHSLGEENRIALFRLAQARDIMELGRRAGSALLRPGQIGSCPAVKFDAVYDASEARARENISASKAELRAWEERFASGDWEYLRWPVCFTSPKAQFTYIWRNAFAPLRQWVNDAALCVAAEVQRDYRDYRLERGVVNYADQIALADELLQHPAAARRIREENFRVILDEAQDTEPAQFSVLLEVTRPPDAQGRWIETHEAPPRAGHFCMVGDFQQSIYRERADLNHYSDVHESLVNFGAAEEVTFAVTFRLDQGQIDFVNATFREILNGTDGQVEFVELEPRPAALPGQVVRLTFGADLLPEGKLKDYQKARREADALAAWIRDTGRENLRASTWSDVAILCPRKAWLRTIAAALRRAGLNAAIQSESDQKADSPAHAWLTALCTIMADPLNSYEIVGVLREVFGLSDHDLAAFSDADGSRFRIDEEERATGVVSSRLRELARLRAAIEGKPLFDAVATVLDETQLRQRLAALPADEYGDLSTELDAILAAAAEAEARGAILADFAETLRADFSTQRNVRSSGDDAIQLITSHKAKGSEWQAVIVPFLGRDVRAPSPRYPCLIKTPGRAEMLVALGKEDQSPEVKDALELAQRQEMERLLYVAVTRARHTLVLVHDREVFVNSKGEMPRGAQLKRLLGENEGNEQHFNALAPMPQSCDETSAVVSRVAANGVARAPKLPAFDKRTAALAVERASEFVHKFSPSAYDAELPDSATQERPRSALHSAADNPATLYGRWWHMFLQAIDWGRDIKAADCLFQQHQPQSPKQERSAKEWKRVRENLFTHPALTRFTSAASCIAHPEYPFGWSMSVHATIEGIIDLLLVNPDERRCLILDWKTNSIAPGEEEALSWRYRPQLAAYWQAVREITGFEVEAGLFSTALGTLLIYQDAELAEEWARLKKLSANDLRDEVAPAQF